MSERDRDDDSDCHAAVGRTWITVVVALVCSAGVIALWVAGALGASFLTRLFEGVR